MTKLFIGSLVIGGAGIIFIYNIKNIKNIKNSMKYNVDSSTQTEPVIIKYDVETQTHTKSEPTTPTNESTSVDFIAVEYPEKVEIPRRAISFASFFEYMGNR